MNNKEDLEIFKRIFLDVEKHKMSYRLKKKKTCLLVATMIVVIMGMSMVVIGDKQVFVTSRSDGQQSHLNSKRAGDTIATDAPEDYVLYDQAEQFLGFPPPRVLVVLNGSNFDTGYIKNDVLYLRYNINSDYLDYKISPKKEKFNSDIYDSVNIQEVDIDIYKDKSTYTAVFEYHGYYCYISSNVSKQEFYNVLEYIHMI